ncbi:ATP-binding protein [Paenibacillus sp. LHD-117]|uniref:hybrid sensor histidine kinase/response regulator n=1 Tax=Paenibacillus sp. LHD-117 TaxID=3071412 RepID=UPI0027DF53E5|nr:ATP-binding protein [Paenibacillus sp. LHD-117]MDQ6422849.1 ATP-binding protein [Paenibacillus sp. LHD-117]
MKSFDLRKGVRFGSRALGLTLIPLISILLLTGIYDYMLPNRSASEARHGVLDLSGWDFGKMGFVNLDGEWTFYPNHLLSPDDFRSGGEGGTRTIIASIPNAWFGGNPPDEASRTPYGTYRLTVKLQESGGSYGIRVNNINRAHRLYVNGIQTGNGGNPSDNPQEYRAENKPYTTFFRAEGRELDVVLQVASDNPAGIGGFEDLQLGSQADMLRKDELFFAFEFFGLFILLLFGGYHLSIYVMRLKDKAYLYSGLYYLTFLTFIAFDGDNLLLKLAPGFSYEWADKLYLIGGLSNIAVLGIFLHHLDRKLLSRKLLQALVAPLAVYLAAVAALPYEMYSAAGNMPWNYALLLVAFYLYRAVRLYAKQDGQLDRKETALLCGVLVSIVSILLVGFFYSIGWVDTDLGRRIAFLVAIAFMNTLLAFRLTRATDRTEQLTEQLILRDKLKDEFLANTSHELKTPLHGIQNMASYLLDGKAGALTDKQRRELSLIQDTSTKLSALVNDLVDVVRLKQGDLRLQESVLDLRVAAQTAFQVLEFELAGKDVRWENRIVPATFVRADENRVRQVLYNLIHNAIKHTKKGWIAVGATVSDGQVTLWLEDTGIGIPKESHEAVFGYFEQAEHAPQDGYTGMGLGLYISRQLVERMGGRIRVERSEPGQGTRMVFTLPAADPGTRTSAEGYVAAASERIRTEYLIELDIVDQTREYTVLVVDDEASNIRILLNLLGDEYNVLTAFSAKEALRKLEDHPRIDLMILDVMMPEMSGIDLCRTVRETRSVLELPVLFATVKDSLHDIELCFRAGGNDFIAKPFDPKTLAARVRTLLSMKTSMDLAVKNEMAFLQAQIKPHFLYNAFSSIVSFCYTDGEKAAYLLSMLSRYLRIVFERDQKALFVPLSVELDLIKAYVEIEKARFGERLAYKLQMDPGLETSVIPSLILQPFVENAIRHGLFEKEGNGTVMLTISDGDGYIRFDIGDDGVGMADDLLYRLSAGERPEGAGIGVTNVRRRLASIPGASVTVDSALERGTKVTVYLPKQGASASNAV